jgi:hypothetical protein
MTALPQSGGSYTRDEDGALTRTKETPKKTAKSGAKKEA